MKRIAFQWLLAGLALFCTAALAQPKPQIQETRNVGAFSSIVSNSSVDIVLKQGSPQQVTVEGSRDMLDAIVTEVAGGKLTIHTNHHFTGWSSGSYPQPVVTITLPVLERIELNGSGDVSARTPLSGKNLTVALRGSGDVQAELNMTGKTTVEIAGSGDVHLSGSSADFEAVLDGSGDAELSLNVARLTQFDVSGSGDIKANGRTAMVDATISGSGSLNASAFSADQCKIRVSGSGDAVVNVKSTLDARVSGSGEIRYIGNPAQVSTATHGSGSITRSD